MTSTGNELNIDIDMLYYELVNLNAESQGYSDTPSHGKHSHSEFSLRLLHKCGERRMRGILVSNMYVESEALSIIHACISEATIPTWIARPPRNLDKESHRKLKANQWLTFFTIFLPLILLEIWLESKKTCDTALHNKFHDLVKFTNILPIFGFKFHSG